MHEEIEALRTQLSSLGFLPEAIEALIKSKFPSYQIQIESKNQETPTQPQESGDIRVSIPIPDFAIPLNVNESKKLNYIYPKTELEIWTDEMNSKIENRTTFIIKKVDQYNYMTSVVMSSFDYSGLEILRKLPGRYLHNDGKTNIIKPEGLEELIHLANDRPFDWFLYWENDEDFNRFIKWATTPDIKLEWNEKEQLVHIISSQKLGTLYLSGLDTFKRHSIQSHRWTVRKTEILDVVDAIRHSYPKAWIEYNDSFSQVFTPLYHERELLLSIINSDDAPEITDDIFCDPDFKLKPLQRVAIKFLEAKNGDALLAYRMGLGKTAISIYYAEKHNLRTLFVTKSKAKINILREIKRLTCKDPIIFSGAQPDNLDMKRLILDKTQYNIINYDIIGRSISERDQKGKKTNEVYPWIELINASKFDLIVFDEAHMMKNWESARSKAGREMQSERAICMSGTPMVGRVDELWPSLHIIDPDTFKYSEDFIYQFAAADKKSAKHPAKLRKTLNSYMIFRDPPDVEINRITYNHELSAEARKKYQLVEDGLYIALRDPDKAKEVNMVLEKILRMKQICADDAVDTTVDLAEEAFDQTGRKVIIFSQFKDSTLEIAKRLGWDNCRIMNGDTTERNLYKYLDEFQDPKNTQVRYAVCGTQFMQEIYTLTEAHTVIFNDLMWSPKDHRQAEGRAFGRTNDPHGGNAYYVNPDAEIISFINALINEKLIRVQTIIEGTAQQAELEKSVLSELIKFLKDKKR